MENKVVNKIIAEVKKRILNNDRGLAWITPEKNVETKLTVRKAKKDYAGIFNDNGGTDDNRVFWPFIKSFTDSIVGNMDYDVGDIKITSKYAKNKGTAYLLSELLRCELRDGKFGRLMNETAHQLVRDGTVVVRTNNNDLRAKKPKSYLVDLENLWTDFNDAEPTWFCERVPMHRYSIPKSWNKEVLDKDASTKFRETGDKIHDDTIIAYRYEGLMPRGWINGTDDDSEVLGLLWITGLEGQGEPYIQSRRIIGKTLYDCSYDFAQFVPNSNRFISVGIPEALDQLQKYLNLVINNRIQRSNLASTGLIEIRKGSGITPQDVNEMVQGGAIVVTQLGADIRSTPVQDVSVVSFNEQTVIENTAAQLTGSTEVSRGQINRSGTTLGQANLEAGFSSQRFQYHREAIGFLFESILYKWMKMITSNMDKEEIVHIVDEALLKELAAQQARYDVMHMAKNAAEKFSTPGMPNMVAGDMIMQDQGLFDSMMNQRIKQNEWKILKDSLEDFSYKVDISVNSEAKDLSAIANNIIQTLPIVTQLPNGQELVQPLTDKLFEILGLSTYQFK